MAGGGSRLPERAAGLRQQPSEPARAAGEAVASTRPMEFEIGVHPADDFVFDPVLGPDEPPDRDRPQCRARRTPEGGAVGLAPERWHAARRPRTAADRGADSVLRFGRLLAGQVQQPHAADLGDPRRAGTDERRHAAGARLQSAPLPGAERPCRAARGRRGLPRRRAAPRRQDHGGRAVRRRRPARSCR